MDFTKCCTIGFRRLTIGRMCVSTANAKVCSESGRKSLLGWMSGDAKGSQSSRQNTAQNSVASNDHIVRTARKRALPMFRYALFRLLKRISLHHVINDAAGNWRGFGSPARIIMRPLGRSACTKDTCNSLDGAVARITKAPPTPSAPSRDRRSTFEYRYRRLVPWPVAPYPSHEQPRPCESPFSRHIARPSGLDRRARRLRPCHRDSHRSGAER